MFEILQVFETAKHEKNKYLRKLYTKYTQYKLKKVFFKKMKYNIKYMELDNNLLREFKQFYLCTRGNVGQYKGNSRIFLVSDDPYNLFMIDYYDYTIHFLFLEEGCDIEINKMISHKSVLIHPEYDEVYSSFWKEIILSAIYNYCVWYIYGKESNLYINTKSYIDILKSKYF